MHIQIEHLKKVYYLEGKEIPVLRDISFEIESGAYVSLTGSSGVGKSTLLHLLATLDEPTSGKVVMDGTDVFAQTSGEVASFRNRNIGIVFQFHHLLSEFTALENVMMPALMSRAPRGEAQDRAAVLLEEVGLKERMLHRPGELSGGEQQRVALARSLVNNPRLLLADEPTGNLDENTGRGIHDLLERWCEERQLTVLVVTHNPRLAARMPVRYRLTKEGIEEGMLDVGDTAVPAAAPA